MGTLDAHIEERIQPRLWIPRLPRPACAFCPLLGTRTQADSKCALARQVYWQRQLAFAMFAWIDQFKPYGGLSFSNPELMDKHTQFIKETCVVIFPFRHNGFRLTREGVLQSA